MASKSLGNYDGAMADFKEPRCVKCGATRGVKWCGHWAEVAPGVTKLRHDYLCVEHQGNPDWPDRGAAA